MKILYTMLDGEITGGNLICAWLVEEAMRRGHGVVLTASRDGPLCDAMRKRGIRVHLVQARRTFDLRAAARIARIARESSVTLIHSHDALGGTIQARIAGRLAGVPVVSHLHVEDTLNPHALIASYQRLLEHVTSRWACRAVIAVSGHVGEAARRQGTDARKVRVIRNGVPIPSPYLGGRAAARRELGVEPDVPLVIHIGRLCESKGQATLIRAMARVQTPAARAVLIGKDLSADGEYEQELRDLIGSLGLAGRVSLIGRQERIDPWHAACDLLALPSEIEGLPLVVIEAMAAGRPVVASGTGGTPEVVREGETGFLVPPKDPARLADALDRVLSDREAADRMGKVARDVAENEFSISRMTREIFALYDEVLA